MAAPNALRELQFNTEASHAVNTTTFDSRILCDSIDVSGLTHERIPDQSAQSRMNAGSPDHRGVRGGSFSFTTNMIGHQGTAAGALTATKLQTLLSTGLGGGDTAGIGTTCAAGSTASVVNVNSVAGFAVGQGVHVGAKGDGGGDGQFGVIGTVGASSLTLLNALPAAPAQNAVVYASQAAFHSESAALAGLTTLRFANAYVTDTQLYIRGCQLGGLGMTFPIGDLPKATLTYGVSYWDEGTSLTIPSAVTAASNYASPVSGGSLFFQTFGTTTRATLTPSEVELTFDLGLEPIPGPGGVFSYQSIVGWCRTRCRVGIRMRVPFSTALATWWDSAESDSAHWKHICFTASTGNGRAVGFYLPRVKPVGQRPAVPVDSNGQNYLDVFGMAVDDTAMSTEISRSSFRLFMG